MKLSDLLNLVPYATKRQKQIIEAVIECKSAAAAARKLGIDKSTVLKTIKRTREKMPIDVSDKQFKDEIEAEQTRDGFMIQVKSFDRIQSAHEAMLKAGIDEDIWEPVKVVANSWEVAIKQLDGSAKTVPLWQVKVTCKRRIPVHLEKAIDSLAKKAAQQLTLPKVSRPARKMPSTMVLGLVDHHFGKLCWGPEVGDDYDLRIAEDLYFAAIEYHLNRWSDQEVSKILVPVGNDFGHIDTRGGTTEAGTIQDVDGRYEKIAEVMERALMKCIHRAREIADVDVIWVGGNHDRVTSMWLCRCVHWAFQTCDRVTVDTSPCLTKYRQFGRCLLGFSHGDGPKEKSLKDMMPIDRANDWALASSCREWITGHFHQQKTTERISTHEQSGLVFRILPSLCATDGWHFRNGFGMAQKASQSLLYCNEFGFSDLSNYDIRRFKSASRGNSNKRAGGKAVVYS